MSGNGSPMHVDEQVSRSWFGWLLAVLSTALTLAIWSLLGPLGGQQGSLLIFAIPVTLAAWYGGPGPGLLATLLGALAEILFLSPPMRAPFPIDGAAVRVLLFGFSGTVISGLCGRLHTARGRAEAHERDARQAVARLQQILVRQSQTEEALRLSEERLRLALDAANIGLWDYQPLTNTCYFNDPWYRMLGYQPGELPSAYQTWQALMHPDDRDRAETAMTEALAGRQGSRQAKPGYSAEFRMHCKDNSWKWILSRAEVLERTPEGRAQRMIGIHVDIDRQKRDEAELRKAKEAAEVANQSKSDFLAHMTHELRTPLNGVIGMIDLLAQTPCSEQQRHYARVARSSADLLLSVINDILDFSKIEAGKLELERIDFALPAVIGEVQTLLADRARDKRLKLTATCAPELSQPFCGDPARLRQVLINLVSNAIKFTEEGEVSLAAFLAPGETIAGPDAVRVRFEVRDSGIGIGLDAVPRLFQAFSQADSSTRRKYGGTGLGLAISKCLVERMDGMIGVESEPGQGSLFWFVVLLKKSSTKSEIRNPKSENGLGSDFGFRISDFGTRGRILVVEDNLVNAEVAGEILSLAGYECIKVDNGRKAIENVRQQSFDLILMDCQLPELDGLEAARQIRALEQAGCFCRSDGQPVPIIALTATATRQNREQCFAAGMNAYLSKPLDARRLLGQLDEHLGQPQRSEVRSQKSEVRGQRSEIRGQESSLSTELPANLEVARERMGGSAELLAKLAGLFLDETHHVVERLREAWKAERAIELERLAHRLKGQAVTFEATAVGRLAAEVERLSKQGQLDPVGDLLPRLDAELAALGRQLQEVRGQS